MRALCREMRADKSDEVVDGSRGDQMRNGPRSAGDHLIGEPFPLSSVIDLSISMSFAGENSRMGVGLMINWILKYEDSFENCWKKIWMTASLRISPS